MVKTILVDIRNSWQLILVPHSQAALGTFPLSIAFSAFLNKREINISCPNFSE